MLCPNCSDEMRVVPAGVSKKTGKAYRAFEVCEKIACKQLKEASRYNVPPSSQNTPTPQNLASQREVEELRIQIGELNVTIAKMRTAFQNHEDRIKSLETPISTPSYSNENNTGIPIIEPKVNIEYPPGFLK